MTNSTVNTDETGPDPTATRPMIVGIDGSACSHDALTEAARLSRALSLPLEAVAVWNVPIVMYDAYYPGSTWSQEGDAARALVDATTAVHGDDLPSWFSSSTRFGTAAKVLIDASGDAERIVLGSRGHGGFVGLLLGSVSSACAAHARCPVLVVHRRPSPAAPQDA